MKPVIKMLEGKKVYSPSIIVHKQLESNENYLICSAELTVQVADVIQDMSLDKDLEKHSMVVVPRNYSISGQGYQRNGAWGLRDRTALLESIYNNLSTNTYFLFFRGFTDKGHMVEIMDGANRLETQRSFIYNETIHMPSGKQTPILKVNTGDGLPSKFNELPELQQDIFKNHRIRTNLYFVFDKTDFNTYDEINRCFDSNDVVSLVENAVFIEQDSDIAAEVKAFCAQQFSAFNKGKQNNDSENRKASPKTSGVLSWEIDKICNDFSSDYFGFKIKRADKENYMALIAFTVANGDKEFLGERKTKQQLEDLYAKNTKDTIGTNKLVKKLRKTISNLKTTRTICLANEERMPSDTRSFLNGDCFTKTDGFLVTAFMFNELFDLYSITTDDDYIEVGKLCGSLYSAVMTQNYNVNNTEGGINEYQKPTDPVERLAFEWYYLKTNKNGRYGEQNKIKWEYLYKWVNQCSNLKLKTRRKNSWTNAVKTILLQKAGYKCRVTGEQLSLDNCEIHHKIPLSEGGTNDPDNLEALSANGHAQIDKNRHLGRAA